MRSVPTSELSRVLYRDMPLLLSIRHRRMMEGILIQVLFNTLL